jgi:starch synthase
MDRRARRDRGKPDNRIGEYGRVKSMTPAVEEIKTTHAAADDLAVLLSHPTGNQNVRNALRSLVEHEMLAEFWTTVAWDSKSRWNRLLPTGIKAQLDRRSFPEAPVSQIRSVPWREVIRLGTRSTPLAKILCSGERPFSVIGMYRNFDCHVAQSLDRIQPDVVYAYEGGARETFREAKKRGITTIHEQPSSYWHWARKLLAEEGERNPEFAGLLPSLRDSDRHLDWKEEELQLADYVFVPSEHVRRTLAGVVPDEKIRVVTYGAPAVHPRMQVNLDPGRPLKVLFVGNLAQHKGIGYLLDAIDMLGRQVELTLVGRRFRPNHRVDEACRRWRWFESVPHAQVLNLMEECDVLVLPSLTEGCALVVLESLACGLPVIVTPNTGSLAFVRDRCEGFVVPICRSDAIADSLNALHQNREMLAEMSRQAQKTAQEKSWSSYRTQWAQAVRTVSWQ